MSERIKIEPIRLKEYEVKQSKYGIAQVTDEIRDTWPFGKWQNCVITKYDFEYL